MDFPYTPSGDPFAHIDEKVDIIFRHQMLMSAYQATPRDYGTGIFMNELDVHALGFIKRKPGITAGELCRMTYRSKGTISIMLSRLEQKELIEQQPNPDNRREKHIYLTEHGEHVCLEHEAYDRRITCGYLADIAKVCTPQEIEGFFKVLHYRSEHFEKVLEDEKAAYVTELHRQH